ncbi:putative MSH5 protein [Rhypophila decipiens]|uniref:MSH5 protein n=1 Tax=Rhypophila decipiens TaxID=261697 RepID=A0AAN6Y611_9PEZI|nr:putative MSH5 protein [Rhypophila decipiens]
MVWGHEASGPYLTFSSSPAAPALFTKGTKKLSTSRQRQWPGLYANKHKTSEHSYPINQANKHLVELVQSQKFDYSGVFGTRNLSPRYQKSRSTPDHLGSKSHNTQAPSPASSTVRTRLEVLEENKSDVLNEVIMALDMRKDGRIGCAYYVAMEETLFIEEDTPLGGLEVASTLIMRVQPTTIMIPNRAPQDLVLLLEKDAEGLNDQGGSYILRHLTAAEFDYDGAKESLVRVDLGYDVPDPIKITTEDPGDDMVDCLGSSLHNKLMRLGETINLSSYASIGCAGAVLSDLDRRRAVQDSDFYAEPGTSFQIKELAMNTPMSILQISADALVSLQIVRSELRPDYQVSNPSESKTKHVLSLADYFRLLLLILHPGNKDMMGNIQMLLRKIGNIKTPLTHIRKIVDRIRGQLSIRIENYKKVLQFSMICTQLKEAFLPLSHGSGPEVFSRIYNTVDSDRLLAVGERILQTFDFQLSKENGRTEILPGASEELDRYKERYTSIYDTLPRVREAIVSNAPGWASRHIRDCIMFPGQGFLIEVTLDEKTGEGVYRGEKCMGGPWEMIFVKDDAVYYKNQLMRQLDDEWGDPAADVADEELHVASKLFGELDSLFALALAAENKEEAKGPSFLVLTGPNNSGKSIYMKQIALIVYLAHIGSYVPASRATIGITDRILTRIATRETMMADESAFCIDLKQAAFTVNFATRRSLILTDEFGKRTTWHAGAGILAGYVAYFFGLGEYRPKMLIGTHFHELHDYGVLPPGNGLEYAHLDVRLDPEAEELDDQITYLYKLVPGPGGESLGILCAELMGVEGEVLERAEYFLKLLKSNFDIVEVLRKRGEDEVEEQEKLRKAENVYQRFMTMSVPGPGAPAEELERVGEMLRQCLDFEKEAQVAEEVGVAEEELEREEVREEVDDVGMEDW